LPRLERLGGRPGTSPDTVPPADPPKGPRNGLEGHQLHGHLLASSEGDGRTDRRPDTADNYWSQVDRFERMWEQHTERWPDQPRENRPDQPSQARPGDPAGSWRGDGDRYLAPDQNVAADRFIADLRAPEPAITADLCQIEHENPSGGRLAGLEHRLKGDQRLKEKIADKLEFKVGASIGDVAGQISDAVRYTFWFDTGDYAHGCGTIRDALEVRGYRMTYSANNWVDGAQYKGLNTRWETQQGDRFEVQFHTAESLHAKERLTHRSYERLRSPDVSREERVELENYQRVVSAAIPTPAGAAEIPGAIERT
jgi:hypothetical protein